MQQKAKSNSTKQKQKHLKKATANQKLCANKANKQT